MAEIKKIVDQLTNEKYQSYTRNVTEQEFEEFYGLPNTKHIIEITKSEYGNFASVTFLAYPGDQGLFEKINRVMSKELRFDLNDQNEVIELQQLIKEVYNINN